MIESIVYRLGFIGILMLMSFFAGLGVGAHCMEKKLLEDHEALIQKTREIEQELIQEQDSVVREYTQKIRDMEDRYAEDIESIRNSQLADTVPPPECVQQPAPSDTNKRLPEKSTNKPGITCYTESELRSKIESSLAIARECDKEMTRFQALIEACQK